MPTPYLIHVTPFPRNGWLVAQYIAMQKKNFAALRKEKMRKPQKRASNIISGHSTVLRSTVKDLKE